MTEAPHPYAFLAAWRNAADLTQVQVAEIFETTDATIHRWETGKSPVTVKNFMTLARLYNAKRPADLMFPPDMQQEADDLERAASLLAQMTPEDREWWFDTANRLLRKPSDNR